MLLAAHIGCAVLGPAVMTAEPRIVEVYRPRTWTSARVSGLLVEASWTRT
jgi:hypothetical protein